MEASEHLSLVHKVCDPMSILLSHFEQQFRPLQGGSWIPLGLPVVMDSVHNLYGKDFSVHPVGKKVCFSGLWILFLLFADDLVLLVLWCHDS